MRLLTILFFAIFAIQSQAQFYYKDIVTNKEVTENNNLLRKAKSSKLEVKSYQFDGEEVENFLCEQIIDANAKHVLTVTGSPFTGENHLHSFYSAQGQLLRSVDSNTTLVIQNNYEYTNTNLTKISITSFEPEQKNVKTVEVHQWFYDPKNAPTKMYKIKNQTDTTLTIFNKDSVSNLITNEVEYFKGKVKEHFEYYYDDLNNLTAVFRYIPIKKKMMPEIVFDYNEKNEIIKKTNFVTGTKSYTIWFYFYGDNGLKKEEQCFLPGNLMRGKLKYFYTND